MSDRVSTSDRKEPGVRVVVVVWVARLVAAGLLGLHGYLKLTGNEMDVELFERIGMEPGGRYLIGVLELLSAAMLLIPQSVLQGAFLGLGIMLGAIIGHLTEFGLPGIQYAILVMVACLTVLYLRRNDAKFIRNLCDR